MTSIQHGNASAGKGTDSQTVQVTAQAIDFLYDNVNMVLYGILLMPIAMVFVMWGRIDHALLLLWSAVVIGIVLVRLLLVRAYKRRDPVPGDAPRWGRYFTLTALANGLAWGLAGMVFFSPDSAVVQVFLYTCVIGLAAGSIIVYSYWLESYYAFIIPAFSLCALRLVAEGEDYQWLGLLLMMLVVILFKLGSKTSSAALASIRLHLENQALIEKLREEKEIAEAASRDKTRFLASASHDLRQPIHALTLYSEALHSELNNAKGRNMLASMGRSIAALNQLLGSLLDISKLDADIVRPSCSDFSLRNLLIRLGDEYAPQAQAKGLAWCIETDGHVVRSDPVLLETMLRNLISNAIRYTFKGGIVVHCREEGGEVTVEVADTGIGIPLEQQREVFHEFFQLANPERDRS
ncbi:MAG: HAMP domain-containing histidine kinase, partial [Gammaproteobacteria bacterium]|nr:HAMP domain-containing histidine kinase [Gammaproteobacteria bacterium]